MKKINTAQKLLNLLIAVSLVLLLISCGSGNTSKGPEADSLDGQFVADGSADSGLRIRVLNEVAVGGTSRFTVTATDPNGAPLAFIRIFCNTEDGLSILDPVSAGISVGITSSQGVVSGTIGGNLF